MTASNLEEMKMSTTLTAASPERRRKTGWWAVAAAAVVGATLLWVSGGAERLHGKASVDRAAKYREAVTAIGLQSSSWPQTESELLRTFWKAIARRDLKQAALFCPGSVEADYRPYTFMPTSEAISIGTPEPVGSAAGTQRWPVKVSFTGYGAKTLKLATTRLASGQLVIDGPHTTWW
jgi:hypothetical protein